MGKPSRTGLGGCWQETSWPHICASNHPSIHLPIHVCVRLLGVYPNHCRVLFPKTTHRLRLLFDGGVTIDGHRPITPDRTDLFQLLDSRGVSLPSGVVLGLADLGTAPAPFEQCEKDTWAHDNDNYLDVCLDMSSYKVPPAQVHVLCGEATQISAPKGVRYPCKPHTIAVTGAQPPYAAKPSATDSRLAAETLPLVVLPLLV